MNSEQEQQLINYLANLGFLGSQFEDSLRQRIGGDTPNFRVPYTIQYGEEQMLFELRFAKDRQFDAYRLESYQATLRKAPKIATHKINGIDTAKLEQSFQGVDWDKYFTKGTTLLPDEQVKVKAMLSDLWQLTAEPSEKGRQIQDQLQYKYWPEHMWDDGAKDLKQTYSLGRSFTASEYGCCNADLAYNIISGKLGDLHEKLSVLELEQYPGIDLYGQLEKVLSGTPKEIELKFERNEPGGYIEFIIPVTLKDNYYSVEEYQAVLTPHPIIEHGVYNGVDSGELEALMQQINWHDDNQLFIFHEHAEPEFKPKVGDVQEQIFRLSQDMVGAEIADRLQLKYWSDATFFSDVLPQSAWDELDRLPKREQYFPMEITAKAAFNLLNGRAVLDTPGQKISDDISQWIRLNLNEKIQGTHPLIEIKGFTKLEMELQLHMLAFENAAYYPVRNSLTRGDIVEVKRQDGTKIKVEVNPEERTLNIYTPDMKPIPVNLRFDPEWRPPVQQQQKDRSRKKPTINTKWQGR